MEALIFTSIESATRGLGNLLRSASHAISVPNQHVPGQNPSVTVTFSPAKTVITSASQEDFPGTAIQVSDFQIVDVLPTTDRPIGSFYLIDGVTYKIVTSKKYIAGGRVVMFQHLARQTLPEGFVW